MSQSGQHKEKHRESGENLKDSDYDGTAARTRPLSFEEIMSKRKSKREPFDGEYNGAKDMSKDEMADNISKRDNVHSKDENPEVFSERGDRQSKGDNMEKNSERGDRRSRNENMEKVSEKGNRQMRDKNTEKVSERGYEQSRDKNTEQVSERGNRRRRDENKEQVSEMGNRRSRDERTENVSERDNRRRRNENMEKASGRVNRQSRDDNSEQVLERGNRRSRDETVEKVSERGNRQSRDENTEKVSERGKLQSNDGNIEKYLERSNKRSKDLYTGKVSEKSNGRSKNGSTENVLERGNGQGKDGNAERALERGNGQSRYTSSDPQKHLSKIDVKGNFKKKEENTFMKDDYLIKRKERENKDSETKLKAKMENDLKSKYKSEEKTNDGMRSDEQRNINSKNEASKKHSSHLTDGDGHDGSRGRYERESKRQYRNGVEERDSDRHRTRKHDIGKGHDTETLGKKERKELSKSHYEEIMLKSGRSRSRDHADRNRRSVSPLPRLQKRASYHGREYADQSSHTLEGKSAQQPSDIDKSRIANNGVGHYKRHGASTSGLGGYSPRKRRTEAGARTPSPTKRSPEKKKAKWDLVPERADGTFSVSVPHIYQISNQTASSGTLDKVSAVPIASISVKSHLGVASSILLTNKNFSVDSVQLTQATRPMRRLYVESIPSEASEKALMEHLNNLLISSGFNHIQGTQPCISCIIHKEKGQALVEFLTPEDASAALSFNGTSFSGCTIKIRRPKDFVELATVEPEKPVAAVNALTNSGKNSPHKMFIGGISKSLSSEMIMEIAGTFGPLKAYHYENRDDLNGPCAFVEYADQSVASRACASLNGMKLGGQVMTVVQILPNESTLENDGNPPLFVVPELSKPLLDKPTQVLKLKNVFDLETFPSLSSTEIEEVLDDVRLECARFGNVKSVNFVQNGSIPIFTSEACEMNGGMDSAGSRQDFGDAEANAETQRIEDAMHSKPTLQDGDGEDDKPVEGNDFEEDKPVEGNDVEDDKPIEGNDVEDDKPFEGGDVKDDKPVEGDDVEDDKPIEGEGVQDVEGNDVENEKPLEISNDEDDKTSDGFMVDESCPLGQFDSNMAAENLYGDGSISESGERTRQVLKDESGCTQGKLIDDIQMQDTTMELKVPIKQELNADEVSGENKEAFVDGHVIESNTIREGDHKEQNSDLSTIFEPGSVFVEFGRTEASCAAAHCLHGRLFDQRTVMVKYIPLDVYRSRFPK